MLAVPLHVPLRNHLSFVAIHVCSSCTKGDNLAKNKRSCSPGSSPGPVEQLCSTGIPVEQTFFKSTFPPYCAHLMRACDIRWQMVFFGTGNKFYIRRDKNTNDKTIVCISFYGNLCHIGISILMSTFWCSAGRAALTASIEPPESVPRRRILPKNYCATWSGAGLQASA